MTEEEAIKLVEVKTKFWNALGKLAAEHIAMMPERLEIETAMSLQDSCSIFSTRYDEHLQKLRAVK